MIQLLFKKEIYFVLAAVLAILVSAHLGYKLGISKLNAYKLEVAQQVTEQRNRLDAANLYAKKKEAEQIAEYNTKMNNLRQQIREFEDAADKDPRANEPALSASSSLRVKQITIPKSNKTDSR
jgi:uncharacterized membrane protein YccC